MKKNISKRNINIYYITQFIDTLAFHSPIIYIFLQGKINIAQIPLLFGYRYLIQLIMEMPTGAIADLLGKKLSVIIGFSINALYFFLLFNVNSFWLFLFAYTLGGIGDSFISGAIDALVYDSLKQDNEEQKYSLVLSKQNLYSQIALITAFVSGGFLYTINSHLPFMLCFIGQILAISASLFFTEPLIDTIKFSLANYFKQIKLGFHELFKNPYITKISLFYIAVGGISWTISMFFSSALLIDLGFSSIAVGVIEGGLKLFVIIFLTKLLASEKIFTKERSFIFFPILMTFSMLPGIFFKSYFALPFIAGSMMASSARFMILNKYVNNEFDSRYRATAISTLSMFVGIVYVFITMSSGPIISNFGGVKTVYSLLGLLSLLIVTPLTFIILKAHSRNSVQFSNIIDK